jgi:diacylglycerol kinase family enzyme
VTSGGNHSPFGEIVVIANPSSGRGRAGAGLAGRERALREAGLGYRIAWTGGRGHATELAREALRGGGRYLVAAGGDGTVHEVVNGTLDGVPVGGPTTWSWRTAGSTAAACRSRRPPNRMTAPSTCWSWPGRLRVDADPPFDIEADGEVLGTTSATFEIIPGAIQLKI